MAALSLPPAVPVSVLRVYEPAEAFPAASWARWAGESARPDADERAARAERRASWQRLVRGAEPWSPGGGAAPGEDAEAGDDPLLMPHVRVLRVDGAVLVCPASIMRSKPRRVLVRAWELPAPWLAVVGLACQDPRLGEGLAFGGALRAGDAPWGGEGPGAGGRPVPGVPLAGADGPGVVEVPVPADGPGAAPAGRPAGRPAGQGDGVARPGRYLAPMARSRARAARAWRAVRDQLGDADAALESEVLARWLEGFHPRSWLELDVSGVAALLDGDDGLGDARLVMECLASDDVTGAELAYQRLRRRSRVLTDISRLS